MDTQTTNVADTAANAVNEQETEAVVDLDENSSGTETVERLLENTKRHKEKAQEERRERLRLAKRVEEMEKAKLEEQGKFKELSESYKTKYESLRGVVVQKELEKSVDKEALQAGCVDVEALLKLGNRTLLQYDEATDTFYGVDAFVDDAKQRFKYLFTSPVTPIINPTSPVGANTVKQPKSVKEMTQEERLAHMTRLAQEGKF